MTSLLVLMLLTAEPVFPLSTAKEVHFYPSLFSKLGAPLDPKLFPDGPWFAGISVKLSEDFTGYVVFNTASVLELFVYDRKSKKMSERLPLASFKTLTGAYEKTTNSWLIPRDGTWDVVTSTFLLDFEFEDPSVPGTKNITGQESSVHTFKKGTFEFTSNRLPPKRDFHIKK